MSGVDDDMLALLREIRDLQKKHFERYVEFTAQVLENQQRAEAEQRRNAERAEEDTATALAEQRRMGNIARRAEWMTPVIALLFGATVFFLIAAQFLQRILPD